jgi:hypothetical protein
MEDFIRDATGKADPENRKFAIKRHVTHLLCTKCILGLKYTYDKGIVQWGAISVYPSARAGPALAFCHVMPAAVSASISVRCMRCRHRSTLDTAALKRPGLRSGAPIASFVKRLRCTKCGGGGGSGMAERVSAAAHNQRRAS